VTNNPLKIERIPWSARQWDNTKKRRVDASGIAPVVELAGRHIISVNVNGKRTPFYRSTGLGGKEETVAGKWYPAMGIGDGAWINKTNGKDLAEYYGSPELAQIGAHLDKHVGDPTQHDWIGPIPKVGATGRHAIFLNETFKHRPVSDHEATSEEAGRVRENIEDVKQSIAGAKIG
jgi:hypothetical protein